MTTMIRNIILYCLTLFALGLSAQQNIRFEMGKLRSPQVNEDRSVTFRLKLDGLHPKNVTVKGDWEYNNGKMRLAQDSSGVWTCTTPPLKSDYYIYCFYIEGVRILDPLNSYQCRDVGSLYSVVIVPDGDGDFYSVQDVPHGSITSTYYPSRFYKKERRLTVYTPPGYEESTKKYPVLYLLHGSGGDEQAWLELGRTAQIMDNLIAQKKAGPMIVVIPNGNPSKQAAPGYTNDNCDYIPQGSKKFNGYKDGTYETHFNEIVSFIDARFRTIATKKGRAITGLSMGGFHTLMISANHPELFNHIGLLSPGLNYKSIDMKIPAYSELGEKLVSLKKSGYDTYWIAIGKDDFLYENTTKFRKKLDQLDFDYTYYESTRGHLWVNWRAYLLKFTPMLFK